MARDLQIATPAPQLDPKVAAMAGLGDYVAVAPIAAALGKTSRFLKRLAKIGKFPPVLELTERTLLVRRRDLEEWERRVEVSPATTGIRAGFLDNSPAEPFAEGKAAGPRRLRGRR